MYTEFYNLKEKPFNLTPSSRFLYLGEVHKEALALLTYGVAERKGFTLLTGEVGTGKTTMIHALLANLGKNTHYVYLSNPLLSPKDFINYLAFSVFNKKVRFKSKTAFLIEFEGFLKKCLQARKNFVLIIDEAHRLSFELLEEIRLLSNLETADEKLINIFLAGQPELNEKLSQPKCRALLQRISIRYHIEPLDLQSTQAYITKRLKMAGLEAGHKIFSKSVIKAIYQYSKGYPRMINILADNTLLLGYARGTRKILTSMVKVCYEDLQLEGSFQKSPLAETKESGIRTEKRFGRVNPWKWAAVLLFLIAGATVAQLMYGGKTRDHRVAFPPRRDPVSVDIPTEKKLPVKKTIEQKPEKPARTDISEEPAVDTNDISGIESGMEMEASKDVPPPGPEDAPVDAEIPANEEKPANNDDASRGKTEIVKEGETLIELATNVYGRSDENILNLLQKSNPEIRDINFIEVGQKIVFPPLSKEDQGPTFTVHIASYKPFENARKMFLELLEQGYEAYIIPVHNTQGEKIFRVTLGNFTTAREAKTYARKIRKDNLSDYAKVIQLEMR